MIPNPTMSLSICRPMSVTYMNAHLHTYRETVSNQKSSTTSQKITTDKIIMVDEYLNIHKKSWNFQNTIQGSKLGPTWPNITKHARSNQWFHNYIHTYLYLCPLIYHISPATVLRWIKTCVGPSPWKSIYIIQYKGSKLGPTRSNITKHVGSNQEVHTYILTYLHTYIYALTSAIYRPPQYSRGLEQW